MENQPSKVRRFTPEDLSELFLDKKEKENHKYSLSVLFGAGFSESAGIPVAKDMVKLLKEKGHPNIDNAPPTPTGQSEYNHLMGELSAKERSDFIKEQINEGRHKGSKLMSLNWSHLYLAMLTYHNYVNLLMTPNFDPIMTEALSFIGIPSQSFDLNSAGVYQSGILDPGSVVYLHGQMHSLFIANDEAELKNVKERYASLIADVVRESVLLVIGYSGECDPILDALNEVPCFIHDIYWVQFESGDPKGAGVQKFIEKHHSAFRFCSGISADDFMARFAKPLVKDQLPEAIRDPLGFPKKQLERVKEYPTLEEDKATASNPVAQAIKELEDAKDLLEPKKDATTPTALEISLAGFAGDLEKIEHYAQLVEADPSNPLSQEIGKAFLILAGKEENTNQALSLLDRAKQYGVPEDTKGWIHVYRAGMLFRKIQETPHLKDQKLKQAQQEYQKALEIKPDFHQAYNNWGADLGDLAEVMSERKEKRRLYEESIAKFQKALEIKPDGHEAYYNWGTDLGKLAEVVSERKDVSMKRVLPSLKKP